MKELRKKTSELEKYYSDFPKWYWIYGLHDAEILSFTEMELPADWKSKTPRYNCLEICLDSSGAMTKIKRIVFYNYSLKMKFDINMIEKPWWMGDKLTCLSDNRFSLEVEIEDAKGDRYTFLVCFDDICVE